MPKTPYYLDGKLASLYIYSENLVKQFKIFTYILPHLIIEIFVWLQFFFKMAFALILLSIIVVFVSWFILHRLSQLRVLKIWKDLGVAHQPPSFLFGNNRDVIKGKMSQHEFQLNMYRYFKGERISGRYNMINSKQNLKYF